MAKLKAKKTKGKPLFGGFPWLWVTVVLFIAAFVFVFTSQGPQLTTPPIPKGTRAAIIDQLYTNYPNEDFTTQITKELQDYGFEVDVYQGDAVTVDLYRNLPGYGYKLIIFRAHSGAVGSSSQDVETVIGTYLFTNERYSTIKYPKEQLNEALAKARVTESYPDFLAIGPKFITNSVKGNFDNTVVIVDGCSCLYNDDLAQAFIAKGASAYLAWNATVDLSYVDKATVYLMKQLCGRKRTIRKAVENTMDAVGPDPKYNARLKYYPAQNGNKTLKELIQPVAGNS